MFNYQGKAILDNTPSLDLSNQNVSGFLQYKRYLCGIFIFDDTFPMQIRLK